MVGENVSFTVTFDNTGALPDDTGYGPFIDLYLPVTGADAAPSGFGVGGTGTNDITATYLGAPLTKVELIFPGSGQVNHPYAVTNTGVPVVVTGRPGDKLVVLQLPFGSFAQSQPPVVVDVTAPMSANATVGAPLTIRARGGFQYGFNPLNDWCCGDLPIMNPPNNAAFPNWPGSQVTPILYRVTKTNNAPESETATGPSFIRTYSLIVDIAAGKQITNLNLSDTLPPNVVFVGAIATPAGGTPSYPAPGTKGGVVAHNFGAVTGGAGTQDARLDIQFYIPITDAGDVEVIDRSTGAAVNSDNGLTVSGQWNPGTGVVDIPNSPFTCAPPCPPGGRVTDKSIATQKAGDVIIDRNYSGTTPGDIVRYTVDFQVSDFFMFDTVTVTDILGDGQQFIVIDPVTGNPLPPTLSFGEQGSSSPAAAMNPANYTDPTAVPLSGDGYGNQVLTFDISQEMIDRGFDAELRGKCAVGARPITIDPAGVCATDPTGTGGTTGQLVFYALILEEYRTIASPGGPTPDLSIDHGDTLTNDVTITGRLLPVDTTGAGPNVNDGSGASVTIVRERIAKSIYGYTPNGGVFTPGAPGGPLSPGDLVTFRLRFVLPSTDTENLSFVDYLPMPVFHVPAMMATDLVSPPGTVPPVNTVTRGPDDTFTLAAPPPPGRTPAITTDTASNSIRFFYGTYDDGASAPSIVDLLFTVQIDDDPYADGLLLTNQAQSSESNSLGTTSTESAIVQFVLGEPVLRTQKTVVAVSSTLMPPPPAPVFAPALTMTWTPPGTLVGCRWTSGPISAPPADSNVSNVNPTDLVTFAIFVVNGGSAPNGAFDIVVTDSFDPTQYQVPAGGLNLRVFYGNCDELPQNVPPDVYTGAWRGLGGGPDGLPNTMDDIFGSGIEFVDPDPARGACQAHLAANNREILVVTYDLQVRPGVAPNQTIVNTGTLQQYASAEGGPSFVPTPSPLTNTAQVRIRSAGGKSSNPPVGVLTVGDTYRQRIEFTVPAGTVVRERPAGSGYVTMRDRITDNGLNAIPGTVSLIIIAPCAVRDPSLAAVQPPITDTANGEDVNIRLAAPGGIAIDNTGGGDCSFALEIDVRVSDVDANNGLVYWLPPTTTTFTASDTATFLYRNNIGGNVDAPAGSMNIPVDQSVMSLTKTLVGIFEGPAVPPNSTLGIVRAGPARRLDVARWAVVLSSIGEAGTTAYEVSFYDTLPLHVAYVPGSAFIDDGGGVPANANNNVQDAGEALIAPTIAGDATTTPQTLTFTLAAPYEDMASGTNVRVVFQSQVLASMPLTPDPIDGLIKRNMADVNWSTRDGNQPANEDRLYDARYDDGGSLYNAAGGDGNQDRDTEQFTAIGLTLAKSFTPPAIPHTAPGNTSTLRFTINNPNTIDLTGVTFTDTLPTGVTYATPVGPVAPVSGCGAGTIEITSPTTFSVSGLTVPPGNCVIDVVVTSTVPSNTTNTTTPIISNETGAGNQASANLVVADQLAMHKQFAPSPLLPGQVATLTFTLVNGNPQDMIDVEFFELLPIGVPAGRMEVAPVPNASAVGCGPAPVWNPLPGDISLTLRNGQIPSGGVCTLRVDVVASENATYVNLVDPSNGAALTSGPMAGTVVSGDSLANIDAALAAGYTLDDLPDNTFVFGGTLVGPGTRQRGTPSNAATLVTLARPVAPASGSSDGGVFSPGQVPVMLPETGGGPVRSAPRLLFVLAGVGVGVGVAAWALRRKPARVA